MKTQFMKKRFLTLMLASIVSIGMWAESGICGPNLTWDLTDGVLTISGTGNMTNYSLQNYAPWYSLRTSISNIIINEGVTSIGNCAFFRCGNITTVSLSNTITSIGEEAFEECSGLTSINIPNSVTNIGQYAFYRCSGMTSVTTPSSINNIPLGAFMSTGLTTIIIPNSVTSIEANAFFECNALSSITIPNSVTSIGDWAFYHCDDLTSFSVPGSVTSIGDWTFAGCVSLTTFSIEGGIPNAGENVFFGSNYLEHIYIPCGMMNAYINNEQWSNYYNSGLIQYKPTQYRITATAQDSTMGYVSMINPTACDSNAVIEAIPYNNYRFVRWTDGNTDNPRSIRLTKDTTLIALFKGSCGDNLTWEFEDSVLTITGYGPMTTWSTSSRIPWNSFREEISTVNLPDGIESLTPSAFWNCVNLHTIVIPNSVTSIPQNAFYNCTSLKSIVIPNSVTSIGMSAFRMSGLSTISLSNAVTKIPGNCFEGCTNLHTIVIPNSVTSITDNAFSNCTSLENVTILDGIHFYKNAFKNCTSLPVEDGLRYVGAYLLEVVDITRSTYNIKEGTHTILRGVFQDCNNLTSITIPDSVLLIQNQAFWNCPSLTRVIISESVVKMETPSFCQCNALSEVYVQNPNPINIEKYSGNLIFTGANNSSVPNNLSIIVPCGSLNAYKSASYWSEYQSRIINMPSGAINYSSNFQERGIVEAFIPESFCDSAVLRAIPNYGYYLDHWSDSTTINPYIFYTSQDTSITAIFEKNSYSLQTHVNNTLYGISSGDTTALYLDTIIIRAIPDSECYFAHWSDGNTENPRTIILTQDTSFTAEFERLYSGQCGDSLYWSYNNDTLSFNGSGNMYNYTERSIPWTPHIQKIREIILAPEMSSIGNCAFKGMYNLRNINIPSRVLKIGEFAFNGCQELHHVTIPNSVASLGGFAFANCDGIDTLIIGTGITEISNQFYWCSNLKSLTLGQNMQKIDRGAFFDARKLNSITCHAPDPPIAYPDEGSLLRSFYNVHALVLIPCDNFSAYQHDALWGSFDLQCLSSNSGVATDGVVTVIPGNADATFTWPTSSNADTYTLEITKDEEVFCTLTFNSIGQLLGIAFAPSRGEHISQAPQATLTTNGMTFQVTGLDYASHYKFSFDTKNVQKQTVFAYSGWFSTNGATGTEQISSEPLDKSVKIYDNGHLNILLPNGTRYDATGRKVE